MYCICLSGRYANTCAPNIDIKRRRLTVCTVFAMNMLPTGMRIPPSKAIRAPSTVPVVSPHFRSQQVMMASSSLDQHWPAARQVRAWGRPGNYYVSSRDRRLQRRRFRTDAAHHTRRPSLRRSYLSAITHCWAWSARVTHGIQKPRPMSLTHYQTRAELQHRLRPKSDFEIYNRLRKDLRASERKEKEKVLFLD